MNLQNDKLPLPQGEDLGEGTSLAPSPVGEGWGEGEQLAWLNKIKDDAQGSANVVGDTSPGMGEGRTTQEQLSRTSGTTKSPKMPK